MERKGQMVTIFFSFFLIIAVITMIGLESTNLHTNEAINSVIREYSIPKLQYYTFLNALSQINSITLSNSTLSVLNATLQNIYRSDFNDLNISTIELNTSNLLLLLPKKPSNIVSYMPVTFSNLQGQATPSPFQQMVNASYTIYGNYSNADLSNVEFFYFNGTVIPSWIETRTPSYTVWWIRIGSIPASSSFTVYMGFAKKSANLLNTVNVGEAPTLSSIYGEYDDGANVFNYYTNFTGPALPSGWSSYKVGSAASYTVDDGLALTAFYNGTSGAISEYLAYYTTSDSTNDILDAYRSSNSYGGACTLVGWTTGTPSPEFVVLSNKYTSTYSLENGYSGFACAGQTGGIYEDGTSIASPMAHLQPIIAEFYWVNGKQIFWQNYTSEISASDTTYSTGSTNSIFLGGDWANSEYPTAGETIVYTWVRLRAYPPNDVMPLTSFGGDLP